jgi:thiol:disulfide interchange protein DsbC
MKTFSLLKTFSLSLALVSSGFALTDTEKSILKFEKNRISKNKNIVLEKLELRQTLPIENIDTWKAYLFDIKVKVDGKDIDTTDMILSNGKVVAKDLYDLKTKRALKDNIHPSIKKEFYDKKNLIAGTHNAKHKLVLFSDPHCPFCIEVFPEIYNFVNKHKKDMALYYYHFPLPFHRLAETIVKATIVAKHKGIKDATFKSYTSNLTRKNISKEEALKEFNTKLGTNIKMADLEKEYVIKEFIKDKKVADYMLIQGTPTLFTNGKKDLTRSDYQELFKK